MIRIGIELNHVVRNVNKQILKYYQKDIDPSLDLDEIDEKDDVFEHAKFKFLTDKNEFIYIDYPFEIFASAKPMSKELPTLINNWLSDLTNYEEDYIEVSFFSLGEEALTIQSTYFFLSKIGTRVRKVVFPKEINEMVDEYDAIITANGKVLDFFDSKYHDNPYLIKIKNNTNKDYKSDREYDSLEDVFKDEKLLEDLQEFVNNKEDKNNGNGEQN
jgi:hypothetical protein